MDEKTGDSGNSTERVVAYIDGFNLYFGLRSSGLQKYYWLDVAELIRSILQDEQKLEFVRYFSARQHRPREKVKRQNTYLEALEPIPDLRMHFGRYDGRERRCRRCCVRYADGTEKMTDAKIASYLVADAYENEFDTAIVVSGDSDLVPPIEMVLERFPEKRVVVAFPPGRSSKHLKGVASGWYAIGEQKFRHAQLPCETKSKLGFPLRRPSKWD